MSEVKNKIIASARFLTGKWRLGAFFALPILVAWILYLLLWSESGWRQWTGFGEYIDPKGEYSRAKTLWDWLDLLIIPAVLAVGAWLLNRWQAERERKVAKAQIVIDQEIALDRQRQTMYEAYLDQMTALLLDKGLREAKSNDEVRIIARARTLTVVQALDGNRKGQVVRFLFELNLIKTDLGAIDLTNANLEGVHLAWAHLDNINLNGTDLSGAHLMWAHLECSNLANTKMVKADLRGAYLQRADLRKANLAWANLKGANLERAKLDDTHLEGANLLDTNLSSTSLKRARYNQHTQWPPGLQLSTTGVINVDVEKEKAEFFPGDVDGEMAK